MRTILVSATVLLAACSESLTPAPPAFEGTYVAESVNQQPLPALLVEVPNPGTSQVIKVYLLSDTLTVQADGIYRQRGHLEARMDGQVISRQIWSDHGRYARDGERSNFESEYLENVAFTADRSADGRLHITQDLTTEAVPAVHVFTRLDQP
jgi:hypothetical protein